MAFRPRPKLVSNEMLLGRLSRVGGPPSIQHSDDLRKDIVQFAREACFVLFGTTKCLLLNVDTRGE